MEFILVIDCGGTNTKIMLYDTHGKQQAIYKFATKSEMKNGYCEMDLNVFRKDILFGVHKLLDNNKNRCIGAICVGHGKGLYVLDKNKKILYKGILSSDHRADALCAKFNERIDEIFPLCYQNIRPCQAPVLLRWLKENQPDIYQNIGYVLSNKDFIRFLLTGEIYQEIGDASSNCLINLHTQKYDKKIFSFFGIEEMEACLPELVSSQDICGYLTENFCFPYPVPVYGGMFDVHACSLASGIFSNKNIGMIAGTWSINVYAQNKPAIKQSELMTSLYLDDLYLIESSSATSAGNLDVVLKNLFEKFNYAILNSYLEKATPNDCHVLFTPFLYGTNYNNSRASFIGLKRDTSQLEMMQAVCEGVIFSHKYHLEKLLDKVKEYPTCIYMSGGVTYSKGWMQMFADILHIPIVAFKEKELGGLAGVLMVLYAQKRYPSIYAAFGDLVKTDTIYYPQESYTQRYDQKYKAYKMVLENLKDIWDLF